FDWYRALSDLSKVVPANTSLQSLAGTVAPGASTAGATSGGSASSLRSAESAPAFELTGCTKSQDDVARLMSRLRLVDGVTRVTLGSAQKPGGLTGAAAVSSSATASGCGTNAPSFDLLVFFQPLPDAGPTGVISASATGATTGAAPATSATRVAAP